MNALRDPPASGSGELLRELIAYLRDDSHRDLRQTLAKLDWLNERLASEKLVLPRLMDWLRREFLALASGVRHIPLRHGDCDTETKAASGPSPTAGGREGQGCQQSSEVEP
jgi:hypothetical protein